MPRRTRPAPRRAEPRGDSSPCPRQCPGLDLFPGGYCVRTSDAVSEAPFQFLPLGLGQRRLLGGLLGSAVPEILSQGNTVLDAQAVKAEVLQGRWHLRDSLKQGRWPLLYHG